jgi:hypothetical protein
MTSTKFRRPVMTRPPGTCFLCERELGRDAVCPTCEGAASIADDFKRAVAREALGIPHPVGMYVVEMTAKVEMLRKTTHTWTSPPTNVPEVDEAGGAQ